MKAARMTALATVSILATVILGGCFETMLNLGRAADGVVDTAYCGTWTFSWEDQGKPQHAEVTILNFDGKQYYAQWAQEGEKPVHFSGFLVKVKDATFAQVSPLKADLSATHLIVRVEMKGTKLMLRHLKEEFFAGITTDEQLRAKVEQNVNNDEMYNGPWLAGSLTGQP